ncbi:uncharacterized protein JCM6883_005259 [Sporobolomyces salmoneus]|uniref:uncharacterized protein n=1 Tax=Sporobolomyces salmoneus TaxID=183962 RepID=UPI003179D0EA
MVRLASPPPLPFPSGPSSNPTRTQPSATSERTRPRTANPTRIPLAPSNCPTHSRQLPSTFPRRRPNTAPITTNDSSYPIFDTSPLRPTKRLQPPPPLPSSSLSLAAELSSFRMQPFADSPTSPTFPSSAFYDAISPLDTRRSPDFPQTQTHSRNSSLSSDDEIAARHALRAGSVIANYNVLDLDFSFLEDEPPSKRSTMAFPGPPTSSSSTEDSADDEQTGGSRRNRQVFPLPQSPRRSDPAKRSALPFPSRPANPRRVSADSSHSRKSSVYSIRSNREERPRLPSGLPSGLLLPSNRLSLASFVSSELSPGEGPSRSASLSFPGRPTGYFDFADRRKRLATFLDETAEAMEGGKSLTMVLPDGPNRPLSQFVEPSSPTDHLHSLSPELGSHDGSNRRETVYFTPRVDRQSPSTEAEEQDRPCLDNLTASTGLGLGNSQLDSTLPIGVQTTPSTLRGPSPAGFCLDSRPASSVTVEAKENEQTAEDRRIAVAKEEKLAEKRRRTIKELVDTERTYAVDMMVIRDIYLARAKGAHMTQIADYVMSTGLGLGGIDSARTSSPASPTSATFPKNSLASKTPRRSTSGSIGASPPNQPNLMPGQPLMSAKDIHVIFANLEEIASLAETFAAMLEEAAGEEESESRDRIGSTFLEMLPRIQKVYSNYCVRHHRAIVRLQELEPSLRSYLSECKTLSHGRTNAWDLASLLIKPVQRCLKYPLLLDQILSATPEDHSDREALQRANTDMLVVADAINESKKRNETVTRIVSKEKHGHRRDSSKSISSMGTTMTKKLLRTSQRAKGMFGANESGGDEIFDTLVALVESTRSGVLRFSNEMRDWTRSTKGALESQVTLVEGWIDLYAPLGGEKPIGGGPHHRLCVFLDEVLIPIIEGPWRDLDQEVRRSLIVKTDHLLSLFDNPRQVIAKRNDKLLDHQRYVSKKLPSDRKGSEDFVILSSQLLEELPRFLGSVSRYFNIIVAHFAGTQAAYHEALQQRWNEFSLQWLSNSTNGTNDENLGSVHAAAHQPVAQIMESLASGLGIAVAHTTASTHRKTTSRLSRPTSSSSTAKAIPAPLEGEPRPPTRHSYFSVSDATTDYASDQRASFTASHRSSATSVSSVPSSNGPVTPPPSMPGQPTPELFEDSKCSSVVTSEPLGGYDRQSMILRYDAPLPSVPFLSALPPRRPSVEINPPSPKNGTARPFVGRTRESIGGYSLSCYAESGEDGIEQEEFFERDGPLYIAEAISSSRSSAYRAGYPILSFDIGERLEVELEEADRAEGGSGWLLGRKVGRGGSLGWARTEDFAMIEEGEQE